MEEREKEGRGLEGPQDFGKGGIDGRRDERRVAEEVLEAASRLTMVVSARMAESPELLRNSNCRSQGPFAAAANRPNVLMVVNEGIERGTCRRVQSRAEASPPGPQAPHLSRPSLLSDNGQRLESVWDTTAVAMSPVAAVTPLGSTEVVALTTAERSAYALDECGLAPRDHPAELALHPEDHGKMAARAGGCWLLARGTAPQGCSTRLLPPPPRDYCPTTPSGSLCYEPAIWDC